MLCPEVNFLEIVMSYCTFDSRNFMMTDVKEPYDCEDEDALFKVSEKQQYQAILLQCFTSESALPNSLNFSLFQ